MKKVAKVTSLSARRQKTCSLFVWGSNNHRKINCLSCRLLFFAPPWIRNVVIVFYIYISRFSICYYKLIRQSHTGGKPEISGKTTPILIFKNSIYAKTGKKANWLEIGPYSVSLQFNVNETTAVVQLRNWNTGPQYHPNNNTRGTTKVTEIHSRYANDITIFSASSNDFYQLTQELTNMHKMLAVILWLI